MYTALIYAQPKDDQVITEAAKTANQLGFGFFPAKPATLHLALRARNEEMHVPAIVYDDLDELAIALRNKYPSAKLIKVDEDVAKAIQAEKKEIALIEGIYSSETIRESICYAFRNLENPDLNVNMISKHLGVSRSWIENHFRQHGMQIARTIRAMRIKQAKRLMIETSHKDNEIAYFVGVDEHEFSEFFSREAKMSATEFRNTLDFRQ